MQFFSHFEEIKRVPNSYVSVSVATKWGHYSLTCFEENILNQTIFVTQAWYISTMRFTLLVFQVVLLNTYGLKRESSCFPFTWLAKESSRMSHLCSVDDKIIFIYWCQRIKTSWKESANDLRPGDECIYQRLTMKLVVGASQCQIPVDSRLCILCQIIRTNSPLCKL